MWVVVLVAAMFAAVLFAAIVVRRRRNLLSPAEKYKRDADGFKLASYRQYKRSYTRQIGDPPGYVGPPGC
jgi:hypothetical protein